MPFKLALSARLILAFVTSWPFLSLVILSFIFGAYFLSVRWGRQALLQVLVLALAGATCKCA